MLIFSPINTYTISNYATKANKLKEDIYRFSSTRPSTDFAARFEIHLYLNNMSISCSCLLLLFLLCLSLHECNARLLGEVLNKKSEDKFHHFSSEVGACKFRSIYNNLSACYPMRIIMVTLLYLCLVICRTMKIINVV